MSEETTLHLPLFWEWSSILEIQKQDVTVHLYPKIINDINYKCKYFSVLCILSPVCAESDTILQKSIFEHEIQNDCMSDLPSHSSL